MKGRRMLGLYVPTVPSGIIVPIVILVKSLTIKGCHQVGQAPR